MLNARGSAHLDGRRYSCPSASKSANQEPMVGACGLNHDERHQTHLQTKLGVVVHKTYWALQRHVSVWPPPHQLMMAHFVHRHIRGICDAYHRVLRQRHLLDLPPPTIMRLMEIVRFRELHISLGHACAFLSTPPWRLWTGWRCCVLCNVWHTHLRVPRPCRA